MILFQQSDGNRVPITQDQVDFLRTRHKIITVLKCSEAVVYATQETVSAIPERPPFFGDQSYA